MSRFDLQNLDIYRGYGAKSKVSAHGKSRPLTGFIPKTYDQLRALLWLRQAMLDFEVTTPDALEYLLRVHDNMELDSSSNLKKIAAGKAVPFRQKGSGPHIHQCMWPDRAVEALRKKRATSPGGEVSELSKLAVTDEELNAVEMLLDLIATADPSSLDVASRWLNTPFWFLQEHAPTETVLLECVSLLPESFQDDLLEPVHGPQGGPAELSFVSRNCIYVFTEPVGPDAIGAMACARRRAHIAGDLGAERWCSVGLAWMLMAFEVDAAPKLKPLLAQLINAFLFEAIEYAHAGGVKLEILSSEIEKFYRERQAFVNWTVEAQLATGDRPTWVER